jgi:uncharacterized membrane protein (DUF485 family)
MLSETVVSTFLVTSITGAGLVLAIYALITPISEKIFRERARKLDALLSKFETEKSKITADSSDKDFKNLKNLRDEINQFKIFPRYLSIGIFVTFFLFIMEALFDWGWLVQPTNRASGNFIVGLPFMVAVIIFLFIGMFTIIEISSMMKREFEDIKKKQKEAKEYKVADSVHTGGYS